MGGKGDNTPVARILIIEDQDDVRDMFKMMLEHQGHEVSLAVDGVNGLHSLGQQPDLVLLDLSMPMAGGELVLNYVRNTPELNNTRVVVVSAMPNAEEMAEKLGADACLKKPVSIEALTATLRRVLP